jgi:hypothetical protein
MIARTLAAPMRPPQEQCSSGEILEVKSSVTSLYAADAAYSSSGWDRKWLMKLIIFMHAWRATLKVNSFGDHDVKSS